MDAVKEASVSINTIQGAILDIILANILEEPSNPDATALDDSTPPPQDPVDDIQKYGCFRKNELLMFGTPVRHHVGSSFLPFLHLSLIGILQLNPSTRKQLLEEIKDVLSSIAEFLHGGSINKTYPKANQNKLPFFFFFICLSTAQLRGSEENDSFCTLPGEIRNLRDGIQSKQQEIDKQSQRIVDQIFEISQVNRKPILYKSFFFFFKY